MAGTVNLPTGDVTLKAIFTPDGTREGGGKLELFVNGKPAGDGKLTRSLLRHGLEPFEVGRDSITPVAPAYADEGDFAFTGSIERVNVSIKE